MQIYCVVWKKYETKEIEEKERVLNKEMGICGIVYYNEIKNMVMTFVSVSWNQFVTLY